MFKGEVTKKTITAICAAYGAGDPDPREPGTKVQVMFKEFALDFDNIVLPPEPRPVERAAGPRPGRRSMRPPAGARDSGRSSRRRSAAGAAWSLAVASGARLAPLQW
jgi:hypothetical protein